jgi:hypothetical protein
LKKISLLYLIGISVAITLVSCSSPPKMGYSTFAQFNKLDSMQSVDAYLERDPIEEVEVTLKSSPDKFQCKIYKRWIKTSEGYSSILQAIFNPDTYDLVVFAYKNNKLYCWGNIDDFKRSDDQVANEIGTEVSNFWIND